jgi:DNA-binding response OmpR family regulator
VAHPTQRVELVRWPEQAERRAELTRQGIRRLLLVKAGVQPPDVEELSEDWLRVPADEKELFLRIERLAAQPGPTAEPPTLDADDVLRVGNAWVALSRSDASILRPLLVRFGRLVPAATLADAAWPQRRPSSKALASRIHRLRQRLQPIGLSVYSIRGRGFLLAATDNPQET